MLQGAHLLRAPAEVTGAPLFTRAFTVPTDRAPIVSAVLWVTAEGLVAPALDGEPVGADLLTPGWSAYRHRLRVARHDITARVHSGARHELALLAGNGWFAGRLGWMGARHVYGDRPGVAALLELRFADGRVDTLRTDSSWLVSESTVRSDDLYDGQVTDLTHTRGTGIPPRVFDLDPARLVAPIGPPIVRHEMLAPISVDLREDGSAVFDFGQNLVGWLRIRARGPAGHRLVARHAEVLEHGELATRALRSARAEDTVVLSGGDDLVEPTLTFHGFRYAQIEGWRAVEGQVEAVVVGSDLRRIGEFTCSDPLLTQLHRNVVWSLRGNTVGLPTDCPQRDERLGWTGDIAVFAPTACFLFDMSAFLRDWLTDLRAEQRDAGGRVPFFVPDPFPGWTVHEGDDAQPAAIWSDAAVWVPWALWEAYGELAVLSESYDSMVAHLETVEQRLSARGVWEGDFQFGDWLDPTAPADDPFAAIADPAVIATAALHRSVTMVAASAALLGLHGEAQRWTARAARLRADFAAAYVHDDGRLTSDAPAVYALAIVAGVVTGRAADAAGTRLAQLVRAGGHRVIAGFAGAPFLCDALTSTGHLDDAHALIMNRATPSWLGPVELGATTIWERWDSLLPDGTVNPGEMTSFNHYALGAVADWIHRVIGGLVPLEPGWRRVRIDPRPPDALTSASTSTVTPYGALRLDWTRRDDGSIEVDIEAPDGIEVEFAPGLHRGGGGGAGGAGGAGAGAGGGGFAARRSKSREKP